MLYHGRIIGAIKEHGLPSEDDRSIEQYFVDIGQAMPPAIKVRGYPFAYIYLTEGTKRNGKFIALPKPERPPKSRGQGRPSILDGGGISPVLQTKMRQGLKDYLMFKGMDWVREELEKAVEADKAAEAEKKRKAEKATEATETVETA